MDTEFLVREGSHTCSASRRPLDSIIQSVPHNNPWIPILWMRKVEQGERWCVQGHITNMLQSWEYDSGLCDALKKTQTRGPRSEDSKQWWTDDFVRKEQQLEDRRHLALKQGSLRGAC